MINCPALLWSFHTNQPTLDWLSHDITVLLTRMHARSHSHIICAHTHKFWYLLQWATTIVEVITTVLYRQVTKACHALIQTHTYTHTYTHILSFCLMVPLVSALLQTRHLSRPSVWPAWCSTSPCRWSLCSSRASQLTTTSRMPAWPRPSAGRCVCVCVSFAVIFVVKWICPF